MYIVGEGTMWLTFVVCQNANFLSSAAKLCNQHSEINVLGRAEKSRLKRFLFVKA